ncbi:hypothetical protein V5O48_017111 [Marasmius crinis-equi]|uniref:Fe2OG dioxygenase domain-containing protein n=1 Tax=Marasmius crinis-equi TaxID=585013 RepID=A0ABR3EPW5_9AGAR
MATSRQTRSGRIYLEFSKDLQDAQIVKAHSSSPPLQHLLQEALGREPVDDDLETFETPLQPSEPPASIVDVTPTASNKKRKLSISEPSRGPNHHRHAKRRKTRASKFDSEGHLHGHNAAAIESCSVNSSSKKVADLPSATGGFIGRNLENSARIHTVDWYKSQPDWQYVKWDGRQALVIVDEEEHIFTVGLKKINDAKLDQDMKDVASLLEDTRATKLIVKRGDTSHLRGEGFVAAATGWSMGQGQQKVTHTAGKNEAVMQQVIKEPCMKRLAAMQDAGFACWSFKNYGYYKQSMDQLKSSIEGFQPNFDRSQFACITCNFGPQVCTSCHTDAKNCPHSLCAITAVGTFDPTKGGHLVLPDLKIIVEFPSGCTILLPSAILRHHNTPVQPGETRYSVTQYSAGGIFRYQEYGNRTEEQLRRQDKALYEKVMGEHEGRWLKMVGMFVTLDEVRQFHS